VAGRFRARGRDGSHAIEVRVGEVSGMTPFVAVRDPEHLERGALDE
jgi:hypothetical protein